ncbi:MAG: FliI/YscN family ATPase [Candidatus Hydrogenedentes bacterium]|nr:FliI/YscN family ATPase [Candidatus Hydrogenedentota bacterium]
MEPLTLEPYRRRLEQVQPILCYGKVADVVGLTIEATGPPMHIGDLCYILPPRGGDPIPVEVVGFRGSRILLMPLGQMTGVAPNSLVRPTFTQQTIRVGLDILGRVVGSMGRPLDGGPELQGTDRVPLIVAPPAPLERQRIVEPLATGIRAIDACITCGKGQRVGILSGSGVGKSKLMGMIARNTNADVNVIALVGERGREVRDFIEGDLGPEGLARSVVVVATSDEPALMRIKGAYVATSIAEWFRAQGADVLLMMDSITRFAMAQREVGLAVGEPPTTKGYPPSVYALLPRLLERAGHSATGSITGIYTVLVEADDLNDPIGDAVRSILDGHIALSRSLATRNHYPAIDVLESVSRCMIDVTPREHQELAGELRRILATYRDAEDLVNIGAYVEGSNPEIDRALRLMPAARKFLRQDLGEASDYKDIPAMLQKTLRGQ